MLAGSVSHPRFSNQNVNNEVKTQFWGICCESGKQYSQVVQHKFHITMAVLVPKSFHKDDDDDEKIVSLMVLHEGSEYLLCLLKHGETCQVHLDLIFDKGENVVFYIAGHGKVCLSGYQIIDPDVTDEISSQLKESNMSSSKMEMAEISVSQKIRKKAKTAEKNVSSVSEDNAHSKVFWNAFMHDGTEKEIKVLTIDDEEEEDDDEEDDEDYHIGDEEETDSDEKNESDEEDLKDEVEDLETEIQYMNTEFDYLRDSVNSVENDDSEDEVPNKSKVSQKKRKKLYQEQENEKRAKRDSNSSKPSNDENAISENEDSPNFGSLNSSTPLPKKPAVHEEAPTEKKKKKKLKKKNTSLNYTEKQASKLNSFIKENSKNSDHGVEIKDIKLGRGPVAIPGKMVHVFYMGRLEDNSIFDSRLPNKKPFSFKLGKGHVIKGWEVGIEGMKVGGKRKIIVPPNMGYGNMAIEGIPANNTLTFVIELVAVS